MYIDRIEIPAFRALRDVNLEFGPGYDPPIFPIGSENGGGKSTLLQLIFALLHCSAHEERHPYLGNILASDRSTTDAPERLVARLTLRLLKDQHVLEFVSLGERFLAERLPEPLLHGFGTPSRLDKLHHDVDSKTQEMLRAHPDHPNHQALARELKALEPEFGVVTNDFNRLNGLFVSLNYKHITAYVPEIGGAPRALICRCPGLSAEQIQSTLVEAASKIFLLGPSNQQYLFLNAKIRKALIGTKAKRNRTSQIEYIKQLDEAEATLNGFYAYDWLSVGPLLQLYARARDDDFRTLVKTDSHGSAYIALQREVNGLLFGKRVRPREDLSGVEFIIADGEGGETVFGPEELSQGELKRLMIYAWLRASKTTGAVVLIDEIETSFHPDWQLRIVRDLQDWAPRTQFLLATHSYELCQALTPRHVRDLNPPLRRGSPPAETSADSSD